MNLIKNEKVLDKQQRKIISLFCQPKTWHHKCVRIHTVSIIRCLEITKFCIHRSTNRKMRPISLVRLYSYRQSFEHTRRVFFYSIERSWLRHVSFLTPLPISYLSHSFALSLTHIHKQTNKHPVFGYLSEKLSVIIDFSLCLFVYFCVRLVSWLASHPFAVVIRVNEIVTVL